VLENFTEACLEYEFIGARFCEQRAESELQALVGSGRYQIQLGDVVRLIVAEIFSVYRRRCCLLLKLLAQRISAPGAAAALAAMFGA